MNQSDIDILLTIDGAGRAAKRAALDRLMNDHDTLLSDILSILETRAVGHSIMYSDRVTPFVPRIRTLLRRV